MRKWLNHLFRRPRGSAESAVGSRVNGDLPGALDPNFTFFHDTLWRVTSQHLHLSRLGAQTESVGFAEDYLAIVHRDLGASHPMHAMAQYHLAILLLDSGRFGDALNLLSQATRLIKSHGLENVEPFRSVVALAFRVSATLDGIQSVQHQDGPSPSSPLPDVSICDRSYCDALGNVAQALAYQGHLPLALSTQRRYLSELRSLENDNSLESAIAWRTLAELNFWLGHAGEAKPLAREAIDRLREAEPFAAGDYLRAVTLMAEVYFAIGNFEAGERWLEEALEGYRQERLTETDAYGQAIGVSALYLSRRDASAAFERFRRAEDIIAAATDRLPDSHAWLLYSAADVAFGQADVDVARACALGALTVLRDAERRHAPLEMWINVLLSSCYGLQGRADLALIAFEQCAEYQSTILAELCDAGVARELSLFSERAHDQISRLVSWAVQVAPDDSRVIALAVKSVMQARHSTLDAEYRRRRSSRYSDDAVARVLIERWRRTKRELSQYVWRELDATENVDRAIELTLQAETEEHAIIDHIRAFNAPKDSTDRSIEGLRLGLPLGWSLLEYFQYTVLRFRDLSDAGATGARYAAVVVHGGATSKPELYDLADVREIDGLAVEYLRDILSLRAREPRDSAAGRQLYRRLLEPVFGSLRRNAGVVIAADGVLGTIPFRSLPGAGGDALIDGMSVTTIGSLEDLACQRPPTSAGPVVVFVDPDFDRADRSVGLAASTTAQHTSGEVQHYERVPGTLREARTLVRLVPDCTVVHGTSATCLQLKSVTRPAVLHVATHGVQRRCETSARPPRTFRGPMRIDFSSEDILSANPLLGSGLVCAGANRQGVDLLGEPAAIQTILTAEDVTELDLNGTQLVVLSACHSGLGVPIVGESIVGLPRAFRLAGAQAVVMSLWGIPDEETAELMDAFYTSALAGKTIPEALREAQMLARTRSSFVRDWAGVECMAHPLAVVRL